MNHAFRIVQVLTCLTAVNFLSVHGQNTCCPTDSCCDDGCEAPPPFNITLDELVASQPLYVKILPAIPLFAGIDNMCFTYIPLPDGTYLLSINTVYTGVYNTTEEFIKDQESLGVFGVGSATCNAQFTVFDLLQTDDCTLDLGYLCFRYGDCSLAPGNDIPVIGLNLDDAPISQDCLDSALDLISRDGVDAQDYFILPYELDTGCVTSIPCTTDAAN